MHSEISMAAWRYYKDHDKKSDTVVRYQQRKDLKIYNLLNDPSSDERIYMFSVNHEKLRSWLAEQPAI